MGGSSLPALPIWLRICHHGLLAAGPHPSSVLLEEAASSPAGPDISWTFIPGPHTKTQAIVILLFWTSSVGPGSLAFAFESVSSQGSFRLGSFSLLLLPLDCSLWALGRDNVRRFEIMEYCENAL